jgi:hypothetical protein
MADQTVKGALKDVQTALVNDLKKAGVTSVQLGIGVAVVAMAAQVAIIAAAGAYGAGQGVVEGIKLSRKK